MIQRGGGLGLSAETLDERLWIMDQIAREKLESDESMQTGVLGLVNHTHSAAPELFEDAVAQDCSANHGLRNLLGGGY